MDIYKRIPDIKKLMPTISLQEFNEFDDHFTLKEPFLKVTKFLEKRRLINPFETKKIDILDHTLDSWKEINDFEFKNLDVDSFHAKFAEDNNLHIDSLKKFMEKEMN